MGPNGVPIQDGTQQVTTDQTTLKPFQQYNGEFVAPVNQEQSAGIAGTNAAAGEAQPYFGAATQTLGNTQAGVNPTNQLATGLAAASGQQVNPSDLNSAAINKYLSPYLSDVVGSEAAVLNQNNQQQQAGQLGNAITSGAFGGDRTGIAAANLEEQQNLSNAQIYSGLLNQGYNTALDTAQQQQGVGLAAGQANRAALGSAAQTLSGVGQTAYGEGANTASELGQLGTGAQSAGLQGAQAQIGAGTVQQQTQQAQDTAEYNQFLQQQSYPFQVAQFLANIAEGTGALSGSTTTTQQPGGFFSDERMKEDMEPIGRTFDGQPIYRYRMKGDPREQIGLSAQKVEKKHPEAVGVAGGFRYVDYGKATDEAANRGHMYSGGVARASMTERKAYAYGGSPDDSGLGAVLAAQQSMYSNRGQQQQRDIPASGASHQLAVASGTPAPPPSGESKVQQTVGLGKDAYQAYRHFTQPAPGNNTPPSTGVSPSTTTTYQPGLNSMPDAPVPQQPGVTTNFEAGPGTTTTFDAPAADSAGLGAADTSAAGAGATDAAATGAADAAGAGAAEAGAGAAAGTAGTAVAGAATDAAATEAAALAAEYAAADAAIAVAAAKRGGAIRKKYADGGSPYSPTSDQLDIPDEQTSVKLQTAGPIQKQPTGLQTAMKMGDPNQWEGLAGSMFSNQGLARGGIARRGYDDGGAPVDDSEPNSASVADATPVIANDADRGAGLAPRGKSENNSPHWWQKSENVLPILSGLAAMGQAKTVHPGVALAAGLGAGAESYLNTRQQESEIAQRQALTQQTDIANQIAAIKASVAKQAFAPKASAPYSAPTDSATSGAQTAAGLAGQYRRQFFVNTARTPEEQAAKDAAIKKDWAVGGTMFQSQADNDYEARVKRDQNNSRNAAQQLADGYYSQYGAATDPAAKQVALAHYNALRQWTGDGQDMQGGVIKNSRTGQPEIGTIAQQGFTPNDQASAMGRVLNVVDIVNSDGTHSQMPLWQYMRADSPEAAARKIMINSTVPTSEAPPQAGARDRYGPSAAGTSDVTQGRSQSPIDLAQQQINLAAVERAREAGDQAPNNRNINQHLLDLSGATTTGPLTATIQKLAAAAQLPSGSRYQEINAYLDRQAATQAAAMGVPHTNAGLAASQTATGTTEYTPQALQEKVKYADALNSGLMAYREGVDKAVGVGKSQNLHNYQAFRSAWARNFDPDIFRMDDALRRGDMGERDAILNRIGKDGAKKLAKESANLRMLEQGKIPP